MKIIFINAAMGQALAERAEIEHKKPSELAGEYLTRHMNDAAVMPGAAELDEANVSQSVIYSKETEEQLQELSEGSTIRANQIIRASIDTGLKQPVGRRYLN